MFYSILYIFNHISTVYAEIATLFEIQTLILWQLKAFVVDILLHNAHAQRWQCFYFRPVICYH